MVFEFVFNHSATFIGVAGHFDAFELPRVEQRMLHHQLQLPEGGVVEAAVVEHYDGFVHVGRECEERKCGYPLVECAISSGEHDEYVTHQLHFGFPVVEVESQHVFVIGRIDVVFAFYGHYADQAAACRFSGFGRYAHHPKVEAAVDHSASEVSNATPNQFSVTLIGGRYAVF